MGISWFGKTPRKTPRTISFNSESPAGLRRYDVFLFPGVAKEWHPTKNGKLTPQDITPASHTKIWWLCSYGHKWLADPHHRTSKHYARGCPYCRESKGEKKIKEILTQQGYKFDRQWKFDTCRHIKPLKFDFVIWIKNKPLSIEFHGEQHYKPVAYWKQEESKEKLEIIQHRDSIKRNWCKSNNVPLLEISYRCFNKIDSMIENFLTEHA